MEGSLAEEARDVLASARALLEELREEGVVTAEEGVATAVEGVATAVEGTVSLDAASEAPLSTSDATPAPVETPRGVRAAAAATPQTPAIQPPLVDESRWGEQTTLETVRAELGECTRCGLCEGRTHIVFGDGNPQADLMFVGEGPGENEDRRGLPFVGRAGELLTQMIEKGLEIPRSEVYICNVVKCRPPGNRTPLADEVAACSPFLDGQIAAIAPRVIVTLGKPAASLLLGRDVPITRVRGSWFDYKGIPLMPTLHPAYILRQYTPENRRLVWQDLKAALAKSRESQR